MKIYKRQVAQNILFWDTKLEKYVLYPRINVTGVIRTIGRTVSDHLGDFPVPQVMLQPDSLDPPDVDFYTSATVEYPYAAEAYFMFPAYFHHSTDHVDIGFAASRNGSTWVRPDRRAIIDWDGWPLLGTVYSAYGLSRDEEEISLYFTRYLYTHSGLMNATYAGSVGRGIWRLDGFMSLDAGEELGEFTTSIVVFDGDRLVLNYQTDPDGAIVVELLDPTGMHIPGFSAVHADTLRGDGIADVVSWSGYSDLSAFTGMPLKIRFHMVQAKLYAFEFPEASSMAASEPSSRTAELRILRCFPNPSRGALQIIYAIPGRSGTAQAPQSASLVTLGVYDVSGRLVRMLRAGGQSGGAHTLIWDGAHQNGSSPASGHYYLRLQEGGSERTQRVLRLD